MWVIFQVLQSFTLRSLARLFYSPLCHSVQNTYQPVLRACLVVLCANMADGIHGQKVFACAMLTV